MIPGYDNVDLELKTPSDLNYQPPTPLRSDDFFSEGDVSADSPSKNTLTRPSDLSLTQTTSTSSSDAITVAPVLGAGATAPPIAAVEDTAVTSEKVSGLVSCERPENDRRQVEKSGKIEEFSEALEAERKAERGVVVELEGGKHQEEAARENGKQEEEEEEEMTQERLQSLLEDIKLEGGLEDEEMTEERVTAILEQVRQAEKDICSVPGWRDEAAGGESAGRGQGAPAEEGSPDSLADSLEQPPAQVEKQNGGLSEAAREGKEKEAKRKGSQEDSSTAGPSRGREEGGERSQHKVQPGDAKKQGKKSQS